MPTEIATFAAGCFWGVEAAFQCLPGVLGTAVGYIGGQTPNPTYEQVCTDTTGHAEAVQVTFDNAQITYHQLLAKFWAIHDPTTLNRQGPDIGRQYRSAIFTHTPAQAAAAEVSRRQAAHQVTRPIVTEISPAGPFYPAEDYHQQYLQKRGQLFCG